MFKTIALILGIASIALAQNSNSTAKPNSMIPSNLSPGCSDFFSKMDADPQLSSCLGSLNKATSAFAPGANGTVSKATISSTLGSLCADSVSNACPENLIRSTLTSLFTACNAELTTSKNADVLKYYDILYAVIPMRTSICSKEDNGEYCVFSSHGSAKEETSSGVSLASILAPLLSSGSAALKRRADLAVAPNMQTFQDNNIPLLYYNANLDPSVLCTACARQVVTAYINFESNVLYGPGIDNSQLLKNQGALIDAINKKCPAGFLNGAVQAAGGLSGGIMSSPAVRSANADRSIVVVVVMGLATLVVSFL